MSHEMCLIWVVPAKIAKFSTCLNESTAGTDASVEASYNVAFKKKPGDRCSDSCSYNVQPEEVAHN